MNTNPGYILLPLCCLSQLGLILLGWLAARRVQSHGWRGLLPTETPFFQKVRHALRILKTTR